MGEAEAVVRRFYEVLNRAGSADVAAAELEPVLHPDAEYVNPSDAVEPGTLRGPAGWRTAIESLMVGLGPAAEFTVDELTGRGERVLAITSLRTGGTASGVEVAGPTIGTVWTVRDGLVHRVQWCWDPAAARAIFDAG